jgi:hypothetical protein
MRPQMAFDPCCPHLRRALVPFIVLVAGLGAAARAELVVAEAAGYLNAKDGFVYYTLQPDEFCTHAGRVKKVAGGGGAVTVLRTGVGCETPAEILSDGIYAYWQRLDDSTLQRTWVGGGAQLDSIASGGAMTVRQSLIQDEWWLYWADLDGIHRVAKWTPGSVFDIVPGVSPNAGLAVDETYVYWTEGGPGTGSIKRHPKDGGGVTGIVANAGLSQPRYIAVDGTHLYWAETGARIRKKPKAGGAISTISEADVSYEPRSLAIDETRVFWTDSAGPGGERVRRALKTGNTAESLAVGLTNAHSISLDAEYVYFADNNGIQRLLKDADAQQVDLSWIALEVTQGIQNLANDMGLAEQKTTFVRAYPTADIANTPNVRAVLHGSRGGAALPGSPLSSIQPSVFAYAGRTTGNFPRTVPGATFTFWLPREWRSGTVTVRAEINPDDTIAESSTANNSISRTVSFTPKSPVCVVMIPVSTHGSTFRTTSDGFSEIIFRMESLWPVYDVIVAHEDMVAQELEGVFSYGPYELPDDENGLIETLLSRDFFSDNPDECEALEAETHYIGMVSEDTDTGNALGLGNYEWNVAWVKMEVDPALSNNVGFYTPRGGSTLAHEMAHNYSGTFDRTFWHVDCPPGVPDDVSFNYPYPTDQIGAVDPAGYYGFDPITRQIIAPDAAADFMSYCGPQWVSDYTWGNLFDYLGDPGALAPAIERGPLEPTADDTLVIQGTIDPATDTAVVRLAYRLPPGLIIARKYAQFMEIQQRLTTPTAPYVLDLQRSDGSVAFSQRFDGLVASDQTTGRKAVFFLMVPFDVNTRRIRITHQGKEMAARLVSLNAPTVHVVTPNGSESYGSQMFIKWDAFDPDGDPLLYTVQYSPDLGQSWLALATDFPYKEWTLTNPTLPGSSQALIRVIATDGMNTGSDSSDKPFTLLNHPPTAHIVSPKNGAVFAPGEQIVLLGGGYDAEDGTLTDTALEWDVDNVGFVGHGNEALSPGLGPGTYGVVLYAWDSSGMTAQAEITIVVEAGCCPASVPADFDHDNDVDADDLALFAPCAAGPMMAIPSGCATFNLDGDADIDQADFGIWQRCYSGAGHPPDPGCTN